MLNGMNIIETEGLTYTYPAAERPVLRDISLQIEKETSLQWLETTAAGSPTFAKTLNGLIPILLTGILRVWSG